PVTSPLEVVGEENRLVLLNGSRLLALQTATGEPLFGEQGLIFEEESLWPPTGLGRVQVERDPQVELLLRQRMQFQLQGRIVLNRARWMAPMAPAERGRMVTLSGKSVYAV